ncbi:MAG TPA: hypothetical protein VKG38_05250 [Solirubrobacteraceae bacterium]|nr:hypothetical protein [Solirubrobacteraceae bacterium]
MTHHPTGGGQTLAPPLASSLMPPLLGDRRRLQDALAARRAAMQRLEADWVAACEADAAHGRGGHVRMDDRSTWDAATWNRYLAAAERHEPTFKPRIRQLLIEIENLQKLLAMPAARTPKTT